MNCAIASARWWRETYIYLDISADIFFLIFWHLIPPLVPLYWDEFRFWEIGLNAKLDYATPLKPLKATYFHMPAARKSIPARHTISIILFAGHLSSTLASP
jgi:hypothetical protein